MACVGRLEVRKGHPQPLETVAAVASRPTIALVRLVAGDGILRADVEARARTLAAADVVCMLDLAEPIQNVYDAANVAVSRCCLKACRRQFSNAQPHGAP